MAHGGVARDGFRQHGALVQAAFFQKEVFHPAVLVSEHDLQMENLFAVADEAEMSGLDHPGVNGADADLVQFLALHVVERVVVGRGAQGLHPGMAVEDQVRVLGDFAFEALEGARMRRRGGKDAVLLDLGGENGDVVRVVVGDAADQFDGSAARVQREVAGDVAGGGGDQGDDFLEEIVVVRHRNPFRRDRLVVLDSGVLHVIRCMRRLRG